MERLVSAFSFKSNFNQISIHHFSELIINVLSSALIPSSPSSNETSMLCTAKYAQNISVKPLQGLRSILHLARTASKRKYKKLFLGGQSWKKNSRNFEERSFHFQLKNSLNAMKFYYKLMPHLSSFFLF